MRPVSLAATSGGSRPDREPRRLRDLRRGADVDATTVVGRLLRITNLHAGDNEGCLPDKDRQLRNGAVNQRLAEQSVRIAHHQVDMFLRDDPS